jgi:hypothetical protein
MTQPFESNRRSLAAIGNSCIIAAERSARDPGTNGVKYKTVDSRLRGNDGPLIGR